MSDTSKDTESLSPEAEVDAALKKAEEVFKTEMDSNDVQRMAVAAIGTALLVIVRAGRKELSAIREQLEPVGDEKNENKIMEIVSGHRKNLFEYQPFTRKMELAHCIIDQLEHSLRSNVILCSQLRERDAEVTRMRSELEEATTDSDMAFGFLKNLFDHIETNRIDPACKMCAPGLGGNISGWHCAYHSAKIYITSAALPPNTTTQESP